MRNLSIAGVLSLFFLAFPVYAANPLSVVVNEIAWMGTIVSANDEWVELYNNTENPINLDGWQLAVQDETPKIKLSGTIPANGFYLLERTDDNTMPGITADLIYKGALSNGGEILDLFDNFGNLIDSVNCSSGWFAGDNSTKQTMERKTDGNWQTSQNPGGTPKAKNSVFEELRTPDEVSSLEEIVSIEPEEEKKEPAEVRPPQVYPTGIVINEILPSPTGSDAEEEWIEFFNQNNFEADLSDWQVSDIEGKTNTYTFPKGTKISAKGFLVLSRPTTKITLNNDGDGLNLIQPNGKIIDSVNYEKAPRGQSYNRAESGWAWGSTSTPGSANIIAAPILEIKEAKNSKESASEKETPELKSKKELAAIASPPTKNLVGGKQIPKSPFILLIAPAIAIFSGIIILILKRKIKDIDLSKKLE